MRILMVSVHFNLPSDSIPIGGVQKHISKITDEFMRRNHIVEWVYPGEAKKKAEIFKPDIVIYHDFSSFIELNLPSIIIYHGWEGQVPINPEVIRVRQEIGRKCNGIIHIGAFIEKWYHQKPDLVLWGGVEEVPVIEPPREKKLLYIGRLARDNSPRLYFQALTQIKENYHLDVCGDGPLREELEQYSRKNNLNVTFYGFINNIDDYIKRSDIIFASGYLSILEAYINKRPVISAYENELKEDYLFLMPTRLLKLDNNTYQFTCFNDIQKIIPHLDYILTHGYFSEVLEQSHQFALQNTWPKVVDKYEELIGRII